MSDMLTGFLPIEDDNCEILILGSMPGVKSLDKSEYYAHPQNQFWRIMFHLYNEEYNDNYIIKKQILLKNNIALWDVLKHCIRQGSMDADIKDVVVNNFEGFFKKHKKIKNIYCNGQTAYKYFNKYVKSDIPVYCMPSTSPANARMSFEQKCEMWSKIKNR